MKNSEARTGDYVKLIKHQERGGDIVHQEYAEAMETLAITRLRLGLAILMVLFGFVHSADFLTHGVLDFHLSWGSGALMELTFLVFLGLSFVPQFRHNTYAFTFVLSILIGLHLAQVLVFRDPANVSHHQYVVFALIFSIFGVLMPWGGRAIAGICLPLYLFYPLSIIIGDVPIRGEVFVTSNTYLLFFMVMVTVASSLNESLRYREFTLRKQIEEENVVLQGYQTRLKRAYERMENLAMIDSLTRVYNRSYLLQWLQTEVYRHPEASEKFSMIMYDIDRFKEINDLAGHQAGDRVLQRVVELVQEELDRSMLMFRYGGDEFCISLPGVDLPQAVRIAERIRRQVEGHGNSMVELEKGETFSLTLSMGVTTEYVMGSVDPDYLIRWLDAALLESKRKGRNCIHVFDPSERRIVSSYEWLERTA